MRPSHSLPLLFLFLWRSHSNAHGRPTHGAEVTLVLLRSRPERRLSAGSWCVTLIHPPSWDMPYSELFGFIRQDIISINSCNKSKRACSVRADCLAAVFVLAALWRTADPNHLTLDTALSQVLGSAPIKCEVDGMNGCRENPRTDKTDIQRLL